MGILSSIISFIKKIPKFIARLRLTLFKPNISDAAKNGDLPLVEAWINVGVSFYEFIFALREAADRGNLAIVNRLLAERLAIINITFSPEELEKMEQSGTRYSSSCHPIHILGFPLLAAARRGHMDVVNRLLELIDINNGHEDSHDKDLFYKAINEAVSNNQVAIVRRLIDFSNNDCLRSALRSAIVHNQTDIFFMLLPDWSMASKTFPLWPFALMGPNEFYLRDFLKEAAKHAQMPIIEKLLSMLNAVVSSDDNIKQIFKIAIEHYNLGVVKDLLPYLLEDSEILCSEMLNAMRHGHLEVVKLLMKISTVAEQVYLNSVFYLQAAIEHDQVFIFAELLDIQDVRKNLTNDDVTKLLNIAVEADIKYKNEKEQRGCRNSQGTYTWYEYPNAKKDTNLHNYVYLIIRSLYPRYNDMPLQIRDIVCPYMQEAIAWRKVQEAALIRSLMPERSLGFLLHKAWRKPIHFLLGKITTAVHLPKELWDHILSFMVAPHAMTQHANVLKVIYDAKTINKSSSAIVLPSTNTDTCVYYLANLGTGYYATNHPNPIIGYLYSRYKQYPAPALVNNDSSALESYMDAENLRDFPELKIHNV